jgi:YHS domain-containing protein
MAKDPVCGMFVDEKTAKLKSQVGGQTYYFCAPGCKARFDADPKHFTTAAPAKPAPAAGAKPAPKKSGCR